MIEKPEVSIIMSVYNTEKDILNCAIESMLNQSFHNFQFIIVDDASDEWCSKLLDTYQDNRIEIIKNKTNLGLTKSLNKAVKAARGKYIARMDADDYSYPDRLKIQYEYMESHRKVVVLGSCANIMGTTEVIGNPIKMSPELRKIRLSFWNEGVIHPTAFIRSDVFFSHQLTYDETIKKAQDFALWTHCVQLGEMVVLPQILLSYRVHNGQISIVSSDDQKKYANLIKRNQLKRLVTTLTDKEIELYEDLTNFNLKHPLNEYSSLIRMLVEHNEEKQIYAQGLYQKELKRLLLRGGLNAYEKKYIYQYFTIYGFLALLSEKLIRKAYLNKMVHKQFLV